MHYKEFFNKTYYNNQEIFNKKLNWFFDIKNCIYSNYKKHKIKKDAKNSHYNITIASFSETESLSIGIYSIFYGLYTV